MCSQQINANAVPTVAERNSIANDDFRKGIKKTSV